MEHRGSMEDMEDMGEQIERGEEGSSGSVSPSPSSIGSDVPSCIGSEEQPSPQRVHRMASTFQLGDEQPSLKPTNLTKGAANSFNNLFGPPAPAKVAVSSALKSGRSQQSKVAPAGLVGEVIGATKRSRKPLPINPLTGQVIGGQAGLRQETHQEETTASVVRRSPGGNHSQLW